MLSDFHNSNRKISHFRLFHYNCSYNLTVSRKYKNQNFSISKLVPSIALAGRLGGAASAPLDLHQLARCAMHQLSWEGRSCRAAYCSYMTSYLIWHFLLIFDILRWYLAIFFSDFFFAISTPTELGGRSCRAAFCSCMTSQVNVC